MFPVYYGCLRKYSILIVFKVCYLRFFMNKKEVEENIRNFFKSKHKASEVKKIKRLAMRHQVKLGKYRKKFCKKCYSMNLKIISIKRGIKRVRCEDCGYVGRWKVK